MGDLTFITDGADYCCIWSPTGMSHTGKGARPLAFISVALIRDSEDFKKWQQDITRRWTEACAELFNADINDFEIEHVSVKDVN